MHPIVVVGDVHEGVNFGIRVDPDTGISERSLDLHRNFKAVADWAVKHEAMLFIVAGDMFDRAHIAPTFREIVRRDVIEPLGKAGVEVWLLAGNHDQPRSLSRSTSLDDYRGYGHVKVVRLPTVIEREVDGRKVAFLLMPYLHPDQVVKMAREKLKVEIPPEQAFETAKDLWREWIKNRASESKADWKLLIGHYEVEGARYSTATPYEAGPGDTTFGREVLPPQIDLAVFGHIHKHQVLWDRLVYTGALERIDWGERLDEKGFVVLDSLKKSWEFVKLPAREMEKVQVVVSPSDEPTSKILAALPRDVAGMMLRIEVTIPETMKARVDDAKLSSRLSEAFHYEFRFTEPERERTISEDFTLDPFTLFKEFVSQQYRDHPRKSEIQEEGERLLREVLSG